MAYAYQNHANSNLSSRFLVGKNPDGCWMVCDRKHLVGGLFADKEAAVHFATAESDHVPGAVCCTDDNEFILADAWSDLAQTSKQKTASRNRHDANRGQRKRA
ncbi:hypothetical protein [Phyllobacterium sp. OV277]|uniref:hypothetical protein n=1 Tax=Phyllobacterium sp. OV277 TaxID=1882772 RepID=UPI00087FB765|nr:hypothetical protein [Phyllobacterium sp. OV277]SDO71758.1 hypothetical protein SAMN05443582_102879 [Phyllobacterium sp. OV277]